MQEEIIQLLFNSHPVNPDFSPVEVAVSAKREARCRSWPLHLALETLQVSERGEIDTMFIKNPG